MISSHSKSRRMTLTHEELFTVAEIAKRLRLSESCLNKWRISGDGPRFHKAGRSVRYSWADVSRWLDDQARVSTSDVGKAA
jgi:excisionase family DNA binding protein